MTETGHFTPAGCVVSKAHQQTRDSLQAAPGEQIGKNIDMMRADLEADRAQAFAEKGTVPPGVDNPEAYLRARSGDFAADAETDWQEAYAERIRDAENPTGYLQQEL